MSEITPSAPATTPAGWYQEPATGQQRWWDGYQWGQYAPAPAAPQPAYVQAAPVQQGYAQPMVVNTMVQPKRVNHVLHLILTVLTVGLWLPVWIIISMAKS